MSKMVLPRSWCSACDGRGWIKTIDGPWSDFPGTEQGLVDKSWKVVTTSCARCGGTGRTGNGPYEPLTRLVDPNNRGARLARKILRDGGKGHLVDG